MDHREGDRSGVGSDVGSEWITGREDRSGVGSDVWITGQTGQE